MHLNDKDSEIIDAIKKLPKTGKQNRNSRGQRKPMSPEIVLQLNRKPLNILTAQRTARVYYKTHVFANVLTLINEINGNCVKISFNRDAFNYMSVDIIRRNEHFATLRFKELTYNSCLFAKLLNSKAL
jgi:hypothetical protein